MIYTSYKGIVISQKAPLKIRLLSSIGTIGMLLRSLAIFILCVFENLAYLYVLKPLVYLDLICIPIIVFISLLVLARNNKIKFSYVFIICFSLVIFYIGFILKFDTKIITTEYFGYIFKIINGELLKYIILGFYTLCLFLCIVLFKNKNDNRKIIVFAFIISFICILEVLMSIVGEAFIPNLLIGQCFWLTMIDYILYKIKK